MRAWVLYHSLTSLEDFLMWELATLQYDAITVCFPSREPSQSNSLVSLKPNSIKHLTEFQPKKPCLTPTLMDERQAKEL